MNKKLLILTAFIVTLSLTSCENKKNTASEETTATQTETVTETEAEPVISETEPVTAPPQQVGFEGMEAVYADALKDGVYSISVDSSSSMFNIISCELTVSEGNMNANITMNGKGYTYLFMGTGEEAENADETQKIAFFENESGEYIFNVPVEALNKEIACAAFSKKKELWYDRILVFRADSISADAYSSGTINTAETLGLEDGKYTAEISLSGGSGRASIESPAEITIENGQAKAKIIWSSKNYDYMLVEGEKYLPLEDEENSVFIIPVSGFDFSIPVSADTTAMSTPHEIQYNILIDSSSVKTNEE